MPLPRQMTVPSDFALHVVIQFFSMSSDKSALSTKLTPLGCRNPVFPHLKDFLLRRMWRPPFLVLAVPFCSLGIKLLVLVLVVVSISVSSSWCSVGSCWNVTYSYENKRHVRNTHLSSCYTCLQLHLLPPDVFWADSSDGEVFHIRRSRTFKWTP